MVSKPPLPEDYDIPSEVNGWVHSPESNKNGHIWTSESAERSVGVFFGVSGSVRVAVFDDRIGGFCNKIQPVERHLDDNETDAEATAWAIERAVAWMEHHDPENWTHPHVEEAVFDPPAGFVLDRYYLEEREHIVCYRQADAETAVSISGDCDLDTEANLETRAYLYVEAWRGSGNATISLAPWLRAHDHEKHEVVEPPEECGLEVALKLAREWVENETGQTRDTPAIGQSGLGTWSK